MMSVSVINKRGWLDTKQNIQEILKADEFLSKLVTRHAKIDRIKEESIKLISAATQIFCTARYAAHNKTPRSNDYVKSLVIGELMAPMLSGELSLTKEAAEQEFVFVCKFLISNETTHNRGKLGSNWVAEITRANSAVPEKDAVPVPELTKLSFDNYQQYLLWLALLLPSSQSMSALQLVVTSYVGAAKRGTISERFVDKITSGIKDDLEEDITLDADVIRSKYVNFGRYINSENAKDIFTTWLNDIPEHALRLRLTLEQVSGSGLTAFLITGRAIKKYNTFCWGRLDKLTDGEMAAYLEAIDVVRGNPYYGFNRDLKAAKSTRYSTIAYVAKELLIQIAGEQSLKNYQGWIKKPKSPVVIKQLIDEYVTKHNERLMATEETEEDLARQGPIISAVCSEVNLNLFM